MDKHRLEEIYRHDDSLHEGIPEKKKKQDVLAIEPTSDSETGSWHRQ